MKKLLLLFGLPANTTQIALIGHILTVVLPAVISTVNHFKNKLAGVPDELPASAPVVVPVPAPEPAPAPAPAAVEGQF